MQPRWAAILFGVLTLLLAGAGCGHGASARNGSVQIALTEYRLSPQSVRTQQGELVIAVHNYGRLTHNFVVTRGANTTGSTEPIRPGQTAQLLLSVTPGKYLMLSTILSDRDLGIYGTLTVTR